MVSPGAHQRDIEVDAVVGKTLTSKLVVADIIAEAPPKSLFVCLGYSTVEIAIVVFRIELDHLTRPRPRALDPLLIGELKHGRRHQFFLVDQFDLTEGTSLMNLKSVCHETALIEFLCA